MQNFTLTITGTAPLLMHNARLADPLDTISKEIKKVTGKRKKTDDDYAEIARLEHAGGLYMDSDIGPFIPGQNIERALVDAAKLTKLGTTLKRGMFITTDINPLGYAGPRGADDLWKDGRFTHTASIRVGATGGRTMRTRPVFPEWKLQCEGVLDTSLVDLVQLQDIATTAGAMIGLGDWRPRFGRFTAEVAKTK
jgi:hypothetical protein